MLLELNFTFKLRDWTILLFVVSAVNLDVVDHFRGVFALKVRSLVHLPPQDRVKFILSKHVPHQWVVASICIVQW